MASSRCRVSFTDSEGIFHGVDVDAESLYEAVAIAVANFREDDVSPSEPGPTTEFTVSVYRNPTEHKLDCSRYSNGRSTRPRKALRELPGASA